MIKLLIFTLLATAALGAPSRPKLPQEIDGPEAMELWSREGYLVGKPEFVGIEARALNKYDEKKYNGHYTKRSFPYEYQSTPLRLIEIAENLYNINANY